MEEISSQRAAARVAAALNVPPDFEEGARQFQRDLPEEGTRRRRRDVAEEKSPLYFGVIKKWVDAQGYGFIRPAMTGPDLFFHAKGCFEASPKMGERVVYRHGWDQKKDRLLAVEVRYETIEHERRRRTGGRPAAAASSAVAAEGRRLLSQTV